MTALIAEKLGQILESEGIAKLLNDAIAPIEQRNFLAHGTWWRFDPQTATINVRGGIQRENEDQFADYKEERILAISDALETLEIELFKLRRNIEQRRGDHDFDWSMLRARDDQVGHHGDRPDEAKRDRRDGDSHHPCAHLHPRCFSVELADRGLHIFCRPNVKAQSPKASMDFFQGGQELLENMTATTPKPP